MTQRIGRPRKLPPADAAPRIEEAAANGASVVGVAAALDTSKDTLARWMDEDDELREAFERGRERERATLHNALFRAATEDGNVVAALFLLKARHGYREGDQADSGNRVSITFALPAPLSMADYNEKVINAGDTHERIPRTRTIVSRRM